MNAPKLLFLFLQATIGTSPYTSFAGNGQYAFADGTATEARLNQPTGLALSADGGTLFFGENYGQRVRQVDISTGVVSTLAGGGSIRVNNIWRTPCGGNSDEECLGTETSFSSVYDMAVSADALNLFVSENHRIRQIEISTGAVKVLAGAQSASGHYIDSIGTAARFNEPGGLAVSADGQTLFVTEVTGHRIRQIDIPTRTVTTLAGESDTSHVFWQYHKGIAGSANGIGTAAQFNKPSGLALSADGLALFLADRDNHIIRRIVIESRVVTTFAGLAGMSGFADGLGTAARFERPDGLAMSADGLTLFVVDYHSPDGHGLVRQIAISTGAVTTLAGEYDNLLIGIAASDAALYVTAIYRHRILKYELPSSAPTPAPAPGPNTVSTSASSNGDPHLFGLHGDRYDAKGLNNTVYCTFSSRDLIANVRFMYDTFLMGGMCYNCMTKVVHGSFMKEIYLVAHTAANVTLNISFSATSPSLAKYSIQQHRLLPDGELKVSAVLPSKDEFIADNVQVQLERVSSRESHLTVKNDEYKIVAKSRMYPWADRNLKRKRLDLMISPMVDETLIPVAPHGLIGQTFDADNIAVDGKLDDYTGSGIDAHTSVVITKAMGEGAIEGVLADYEINRADPFSTVFKYSRFGLEMAHPRNISALSGTKRKIVKVKGIPASASTEHDITDAMTETSTVA